MNPEYPRTYRIEPPTRRFIVGVALLLPAIGLGGTFLQLSGAIHRSLRGAGLIVNNAGLLVVSVMLWWGASRRVTLTEDAIEVSDWLSTRKLRRDQIRSRRIARGGRYRLVWYQVLVPADPRVRPLKLPPFLETDQALSSWIKSIPLDRPDRST